MDLKTEDFSVYEIIQKEFNRQQDHIELIASENFVSQAVLEAQGSIMTNKYAEGYPGKRYYGGCEYVDEVERLAIERVCELFHVKFANVQPHSGSQANMGAYHAMLTVGDRILGMDLSAGGHLTHGFVKNFSGQEYESFSYGVNADGYIDYENVRQIALEVKPKVIVAGASAYSRAIDFKKFKEIATEVGAYLMVDMAHIAGLVAAGLHQNPCDYADIVTSTTHKTLRGPRGGIILTNNEELFKKINSAIFPGIQGGPLMHVIAAKAVAFGECLKPEFKVYASQIIKNTQALAKELMKLGYKVVSGGSDNHLILVDIFGSVGLTGKKAETILGNVNITCNKNTIPGETQKATITSGIRLGSAAVTTRGFKEAEMILVADYIDKALKNCENEEVLAEIKNDVLKLMAKFPYLK